jgi:hypothetical protein
MQGASPRIDGVGDETEGLSLAFERGTIHEES